MKLLLLLLAAATWFTGPLNPWPTDWHAYQGRVITLEGTARDAKIGALLESPSGRMWVDLDAWPADVTGKVIRVTGQVASRNDLPLTDDKYSGGGAGTSRQRYVLTDIKVETTDTRP